MNKKQDSIISWKKVGQCDYRYADIHSFICLDVDTSYGRFRSEIEKDLFIFNPKIKQVEEEVKSKSKSKSSHLGEDENINDYEIGEIKW
jgi:hypothetical protein